MPKSGPGISIQGDSVILPLVRVRAVRALRSGLLELTYKLSECPGCGGFLALVDCRLSQERVEREVEQARRVLRPDLLNRLQVLFLSAEQDIGEGLRSAGLGEQEVERVEEALSRISPARANRRIPRAAQDLVFEYLLNAYLLGKGPLTTESVMRATGYSYPPVAKALELLDPFVRRHSDRRLELACFPCKEWRRYLGVYERGRFADKFEAPAGLARSPDQLLSRLLKLQQPGVAISGVHAARHYFPDLDLVGAPRLDLCLHMPRGYSESRLPTRLDPALESVGFDSGNPALVIWPVYRAVSMFDADGGDQGLEWADPVSCLLALHDARLEAQAQELVDAFESGLARGATADPG